MRPNLIAKILTLSLSLALALVGGAARAKTEEGEQGRSLGRKVEDAAITTRIKTRYLVNRNLNGLRINVDTEDGVVTLQGVVREDIERDLAGSIAKGAGGVVSVRNKLRVSEGAVEGPEEVDRTFSQAVVDGTTTASVKTALAFARGVKASEINVTTRWGTVTLAGVVGTRAEKELARKTAEDVAGVKDVVNRIQVAG